MAGNRGPEWRAGVEGRSGGLAWRAGVEGRRWTETTGSTRRNEVNGDERRRNCHSRQLKVAAFSAMFWLPDREIASSSRRRVSCTSHLTTAAARTPAGGRRGMDGTNAGSQALTRSHRGLRSAVRPIHPAALRAARAASSRCDRLSDRFSPFVSVRLRFFVLNPLPPSSRSSPFPVLSVISFASVATSSNGVVP
jgi:hypothetical protein